MQREFVIVHILSGHRQHVDTCTHIEVKIIVQQVMVIIEGLTKG